MKKIIAISILFLSVSLFTFCGAQSISLFPRFGVVPNDDNTGRVLTYYYYTPADIGHHDTAKFTPHGYETFIEPSDSIYDTIVFNANNALSRVCDRIEFQCVGADTLYSAKHIIFNKGFKGPNLTIPVAAKKAYHITFIYDSASWRETSFIGGN